MQNDIDFLRSEQYFLSHSDVLCLERKSTIILLIPEFRLFVKLKLILREQQFYLKQKTPEISGVL